MDRETLLQIVFSTLVVFGFIGVLALLSTTFSTNGGMTRTGGYALVASLVGFVFVLFGAGLAITNHFEGENGDADA